MTDVPKIEPATGDELTRLGELHGVLRMNGEEDSSYRKRVLDAALAINEE
jgi:hypothetical protein